MSERTQTGSLSDDRIDGLLRAWGVRVRADEMVRLTAATTDSAAEFLDVGALLSPEGKRRAHRRLVPAVVAACSVALIAAATVMPRLLPDRHHGGTAGMTKPAATDYDALILRESDRVSAYGLVVAAPGTAVQFCPDPIIADTGPSPAAVRCLGGVTVTGVHLDELRNRQLRDRIVTGTATLSGIWHDGHLRVTAQNADHITPVDPPPLVPCADAAGGSLSYLHAGSLDISAFDSYRRSHPGSVLDPQVLRDAAGHRILYVLATTDPVKVKAALAKSFGDRTCVVRSRYTQTQVDSAARIIEQAMSAAPYPTSAAAGRNGSQPRRHLSPLPSPNWLARRRPVWSN